MRVDNLERRVTTLEKLPARIDALTVEVSGLRTEMRAEFVAIRAEMRAGDLALGARIDEKIDGLATEMRVLHEDVIGRIALLGEALNGRKARKPRRR